MPVAVMPPVRINKITSTSTGTPYRIWTIPTITPFKTPNNIQATRVKRANTPSPLSLKTRLYAPGFNTIYLNKRKNRSVYKW